MYVALFAIGGDRRLDGGATGGSPFASWRPACILADWLAIAFIALVGVAFLISDESLSSRLINARRLASLPILFLAGRTFVASRGEFSRATAMLVGIAVVVAIAGLVELLVLGDRFWIEDRSGSWSTSATRSTAGSSPGCSTAARACP